MLETWTQWTCNGCGATDNSSLPNMTVTEVRIEMKRAGWVKVRGGLDYCKKCVEQGLAAQRHNLFG